MDVFDVLDCALRTRFITVSRLRSVPIWNRLPAELAAALPGTDEALGDVRRILWRVRHDLLGRPESSEERTREMAEFKLGLLALRYRDGRLEATELLTRAFHIADSYICGIDARPFLRLRNDVVSGRANAESVTELFAPYATLAEQVVRQWELRPG